MRELMVTMSIALQDIYESMGARSFYHRKSSSDNSFSELGPSYMKTREHKQ